METIEQGLSVMLIGFSTVFCFLCILIIAMSIQAKVIAYLNKIFPVAAAESAAPRAIKASDDAEVAIAIACATLKQNHG